MGNISGVKICLLFSKHIPRLKIRNLHSGRPKVFNARAERRSSEEVLVAPEKSAVEKDSHSEDDLDSEDDNDSDGQMVDTEEAVGTVTDESNPM